MARAAEHTAKGATFSVGPMDVDSAAGLTARLGTHNKASALLRRHAASFPPALMRILQLPKDDDASEAVNEHLDAVREAALSARGRHQFFREGDTLLAASVRVDEAAKERFVAVIYRKPSKRVARGALDFDSVIGLEEAVEQHKADKAARAAGFTSLRPVEASLGRIDPGAGASDFDLEDARREAREEALADARREAEEQTREQANTLREVQERVEALEDPEPFDGYSAMNAKDLASLIKADGLSLYGRVGLERIVAFEEAHSDRSTVVEAAKDVLAAAEAASQ